MKIFSSLLVLAASSVSAATRKFVNANEKDSEFILTCDPKAGSEPVVGAILIKTQWFYAPYNFASNFFSDDESKIFDTDTPAIGQKFGDSYSIGGENGELKIKGSNGDGSFNAKKDTGKFTCRLEYDTPSIVDNVVMLIINDIPKLEERSPKIIEIQNDDNVYENGYKGNLATCQSGYASPKPEIKWEVFDNNNVLQKTLYPTTQIFSDNEELIDDDDTDSLHQTELPLTFYESEKGDRAVQSLTSEYHLYHTVCVVSYTAAKDGEQNKVEVRTRFPAGNVNIAVTHAVSTVDIMIDQKTFTGDAKDIDLTFGAFTGYIDCHSDGYDDEGENKVVMDPKKPVISKENTEVTVTCTASNNLNTDPISRQIKLAAAYIGEAEEVENNKGFRVSDPHTIRYKAESSSSDPDAVVYELYEFRGKKEMPFGDENEKRAVISEIDSENKDYVPVEPKNNKFLVGQTTYYLVTSIKDTEPPIKNIQIITPDSSARSSGSTDYEPLETLPIHYAFTDLPEKMNDPDSKKIRFWAAKKTEEKIKLVEVTTTNEDNGEYLTPASGNRRELLEPSDQYYIACYDHDGQVNKEVKDATNFGYEYSDQGFKTLAGSIFSMEEKFCKFYSIPPQQGGLWWLWIVLLIILIIILAVLFWRYKVGKNEERSAEDGPEIEANQTKPVDAGDEFEIKDEKTPNETSPMLEEQQSQES